MLSFGTSLASNVMYSLMTLQYSQREEHAARLENVLERFDKANLQLHPGKCAIAQPRVNYLVYVLSDNGVSASADKVKAVKNYPTPRSPKEVRAF